MKLLPRLYLALLLAAPLTCAAAPSFVQGASDEASFDYSPPGQAAAPQAAPQKIRMDMSEVDIITTSSGETQYRYKHRWKIWIERLIYVCLAAVALLALTASLGKADEQSLMLSYFLGGVNLMMGQWALVCSLTLIKLRPQYGYPSLPAGLVIAAAAYFLLMKTRAADVSLSEIRDSFLRPAGDEGADQRLASVDGTPGDWPDNDMER